MVEKLSIVVFTVAGRTHRPNGTPSGRETGPRRARPIPGEPGGKQPVEGQSSSPPTVESDDAVVRRLNEAAWSAAKDVEKEILALLPPDPFLSVQASIRFRSGSIVMVGTVAILSWAGSIALDTLRAQLGEVVAVVIQRVIGNLLLSLAPDAPLMECQVSAAEEPAKAMPTVPARRWGVGSTSDWRSWLLVALAVAVAMLFVDRFFEITPRAPPPAQALLPPPMDKSGN